jgi:beta-lactam-binding protein with PASTA domain
MHPSLLAFLLGFRAARACKRVWAGYPARVEPGPPRPPDAPPVAPPDVPPPDPYAPEPPPDRHLWPWLLALAIVVLGGLAALLLFSTRDHHKKRTVTVVATRTVPTVVSLSRADAVKRVTQRGFNAQIRFTPSSSKKGMVVAQAPDGGTRLSQGGTVALTVSAGKPKLAVPNVVGLRAATAVKKLEAAGLAWNQRVVFAPAPPGRVTAERPAAGTAVKKGSTVALTVSRGPQRVSVPNVVGRTRDDAIARLRSAGFHAAVFSVPSTSPRRFVVAQNPQAASKAPKGSRVRINVSQGAPAATTTTGATTTTTTAASAKVPRVVGLSQTAAQRRLHAAGFRVRTAYVASSKPVGTVVAQQPASGMTLRRGAVVRINVSVGSNPQPAKAVPDVTGEDEATARSHLEAAGFEVSVVAEPTTDENEDGIVIDEDPAAGTRAPAGSLVTIYVGSFTG